MHFISRGKEPAKLKYIRNTYTKAWIDRYRKGVGSKPSDRKWREFFNEIRVCFAGCCGYCEDLCNGEVDHFRPKSKFPELVYEWNNWVFSCHDCNLNKWEHWPASGFLDPCCKDSFCGTTQSCFIYDLETGEVLPYPGLSTANRKRAKETIRLLNLNSSFRLRKRLDHIRRLDSLVDLAGYNLSCAAEEFAILALPSSPISSLTKYYLELRVF